MGSPSLSRLTERLRPSEAALFLDESLDTAATVVPAAINSPSPCQRFSLSNQSVRAA